MIYNYIDTCWLEVIPIVRWLETKIIAKNAQMTE
jgi:hypothetical protein